MEDKNNKDLINDILWILFIYGICFLTIYLDKWFNL